MATIAIFSSLRRRRTPYSEAFLAAVQLSDVALVQMLFIVANELISSFSNRAFPFQRKNSRLLIWKIEVFVVLFDFLRDSGSTLSSTVVLCLKELYLLIYRSKTLLDYCSQSIRLWLLLQNSSISGHFHDLNQEISTLLDVLPLKELSLTPDVREHLQLMRKQARRAKLFVDQHDENLRLHLYSFLDEFEQGRILDAAELQTFFIEKLGIQEAKISRTEIEFIEEHIYNNERGC
uniref:PUB 12/19-like N-terminal domain-containing protein n=1 Tax=Nelumbo nucifera TaxID=4432 RepID=A0A822Y299_NELNU|nr:TPA_asm: hypothetical protein HUJ06_026649 [Nelumbo nucifera]